MSPYRVLNSSAAATIRKYDDRWDPLPFGYGASEARYKENIKHYTPIYKAGDIIVANNSDAKMMITEIKGAYYMFSILGTAKTGSAHIEDFDLNTSVFLVA